MSIELLRSTAFAPCRRLAIASRFTARRRHLQTLQDHPHVYVFGDGGKKILTFVKSPKEDLAIGTSPVLPPASGSFVENPKFRSILQSVLKQYAHQDPHVVAEAKAFASNAGSSFGSGGAFLAQQQGQGVPHGGGGGAGGDGAGGASAQGGRGAGGRGGHVHVWDLRNAPDYGRIPDPEDIFGSLEVDSQGRFVDGDGRYQDSGTHRMISFNGLFKLTPFLREKLVERLDQENSSQS